MSDTEEIVRIAAKGDGVTASGRHVAGTAPGDIVKADGTVIVGPHHVDPPCRHFRSCGGCQLQHLDEASLADFVTDRVANAARGQDLQPQSTAPADLSQPHSRRRATLHAANGGGRPLIGFKAAGSHKIVDLRECHVLDPRLFALVEPLRKLLGVRKGRYQIEISMTLVDQGIDCTMRGYEIEGLEATESLLDFCRDHQLARLSLDHGYGPEGFWEPEPVTVTLGNVPVPFPEGGFLQATQHGESVLAGAASEWLQDCARVADLFAGLGTFSFALPLPTQVLAAEASRDAHIACRTAAVRARRDVQAVHRDLFRNPLRAEELAQFDGIVLDPPRAGARTQLEQIVKSGVARVVYISCNPSSWARDCAMLRDAGYRLAELRPVGQFRWSTHVELASLFLKDGE